MPQEPEEDIDEGKATILYNDERTKCTIEIGDCEFTDLDVEPGVTHFLDDDEADKKYALSVSADGSLSVYELIELETEEVEEDEEEAGAGTAT